MNALNFFQICCIVLLYSSNCSSLSVFKFLYEFWSPNNNSTDCSGFICSSDKKCIQESYVCDGIGDCKNGEDEINCKMVQCREGYFECRDRKSCIKMEEVCDKTNNCTDGSDETAAACEFIEIRKDPFGRRYFSCGSQYDISLSYDMVCDGHVDCELTDADEAHCPKTKTCEFQCKDSKKCIRSYQICDKKTDCRDGSDETNCYYNKHKSATCSHLLKSCDNPLKLECIPQTFWCDGSKDCSNGKDEEYCNFNCSSEEFACHSGELCIPQHQLCDNFSDCIDSSDENNCPEESKQSCDKETEFSCEHVDNHTSKQCIGIVQVCNGKPDCENGNDERGSNSANCTYDPCTKNNGNCSQICSNLFGVVKCSCMPGYQLSRIDNVTCDDINECDKSSPCAQFCHNVAAGFTCSCRDEYIEANKVDCELKENRIIYYTTPDSVRKYDFNKKTVSNLVKRDRRFVSDTFTAMDVSKVKNKTTLALAELKSIYLITLTESFYEMEFQMLANGTVGEVNSLVYDSANNLVYFVDVLYQSIEAISIISKLRVQLMTEAIVNSKYHPKTDYQPRSLILDYQQSRLMWLNTDPKNTRIECMDRDGKNHQIWLQGGMHSPVALTIDSVAGRLYWIDKYYGTLESAFLSGSPNRTINARLSHQVRRQPYGMIVFEDNVLWSDIERRGLVYAYNKRSERVSAAHWGIKEHAMTLVSTEYSSQSQQNCPENLCRYMCLPGRNTSYSCVCSDLNDHIDVGICHKDFILFHHQNPFLYILIIIVIVASILVTIGVLWTIGKRYQKHFKKTGLNCALKSHLNKFTYHKQNENECLRNEFGENVSVQVEEDSTPEAISINDEKYFITDDQKTHLIID